MKKLLVTLSILLACPFFFAQQAAGQENAKPASGLYVFNGQQPDIIPATTRSAQNLLRRTSVVTTEEHMHTGDCCGGEHVLNGTSVCGTVEYNNTLRKQYPGMASDQEFESFMRQASQHSMRQSSMKKSAADGEKVYKIPVIVHVVYYDGQAIGEDHNLSDEAVYSQLNVLNEDFRRKTNTRGYNNFSVGIDARIEFVPAKYDPQGNLLPKPGIHRVKAETITDGANVLNTTSHIVSTSTGEWIKAQTCWEPNCYLNVWTMALSGGVLGLGTFPDVDLPGIAGYDLTPPAMQDGVMIDYRRCGSYEKGPFPNIAQNSYGRTLTHEIGHFLGLRHTFGDAPTDAYGQRPEGCRYDDYVEDTPNSKIPMYDQTSPLYLCGEREMIENYMDYSPEKVMSTFTQGQVTRMHLVLENSPRRKQLTTSAVADENGDKTPVVAIKTPSSSMYVKDIFSFEALVEHFPGSYSWTFEDGVPATSAKRSEGVFFTSPGQKKVVLTVSNNFSSVTKILTVEVKAPEACLAVYASTLSTLSPFSSRAIDPGSFATGHGNVFGYKFLANRFETDSSPEKKGITQMEMKFNNFYYQDGYNADELFKVYVMSETYDSICISKSSSLSSDNFKVYESGEALSEQHSLSYGERDTLIMAYKGLPDMIYDIDDSNADWFICKRNRPGDTLAVQHVRVGDVQNAYNRNKSLLVKLDKPIVPKTSHYYLVINLDYDYYAANRRKYSFEYAAGFSPTNFAWACGPITINNARTNPTVAPYILEWKPFDMPAYANSWGAPILMHMLPVYTSDSVAFAKPNFTLSADTVAVNQPLTLTLVGSKPENVSSLKWTIQKEDKTYQTTADANTATYTYSQPGVYEVKLTYVGEPCLQQTTIKKVVVKGIRFKIADDRSGLPLFCSNTATSGVSNNSAILSVNEIYKSGTGVTYTWHGDVIEGQTGLSATVYPGTTKKYYVTAVDNADPAITAKDSITIAVNSNAPTADFEVLTPHLRRGDTLDIYISDANGYFEVKNKSQNLSHRVSSGKVIMDSRWYIESPSAPLYSGTATMAYDLKTLITTGVATNGPGLYRLTLQTCNRGCYGNPFMAGTAIAGRIVYLNIMGQQSFGALEFKANGAPMTIASPPAYSNSRGSYSTYVAVGGSVSLEAVSPEITAIKWSNGYTGETHTTKKIELNDVRDITWFTVAVTRHRSNGQSVIDYNEEVQVIVYPDTYKPTEKAIAKFAPSADSVCIGSKVRFSNQSTNAVDFKWEFSGGVPAEDRKEWGLTNLWDPTRQFNAPGSYTVKLTVTSHDGSTNTYSRTITAMPAQNPRLAFALGGRTPAKMVADTIFALDGGGFTLSVSGLGISKIKEYTTEVYRSADLEWRWNTPTTVSGMDINLNFHLNGINPGEPDHNQKVKVTGLACDGSTEVSKTFEIKMVPILNPDDFNYKVNNAMQQMADKSLLPEQSLCPGQPLNLELICNNVNMRNYITVSWYEVDESGHETLLGTGLTYSIIPSKNAMYKMMVLSKVGQYITYTVPVKIGTSLSQLRLMNTDIQMTGNVVNVPAGYNSDLVFRVDDLINPTWLRNGSSTVLSNSNAFVVTPANTPGETKYLVSAPSPSGGSCQYELSFSIVRLSAPVDPDDTGDATDEGKAIDMYPVPTRDVLNIDSPYEGDAYIVSGNGQLVRQFRLTTGKMTISVNGLAAGVYRLVVQQAKSGKIISRTFIVAR